MNYRSKNEAVSPLWHIRDNLDYIDKWFLMESPIPILIIFTSYLLFVLKLGPDYMKKRAAFNLSGLLIVYNILQIIYSAHLFYVGMQILKPVKYIFISCITDDDTMQKITSLIYIFIVAKLSELLDTVFFVLRKKQNQVTFLHVYHHIVMITYSWIILKFEPSYTIIFSGTLNAFVHVIMYTYYGLTAFPSISKYLWWKKYITRIQLVQFALVVLHALGHYIFSECSSSAILLTMTFFTLLSISYLFYDFYIKTYNKNKRKSNAISSSNERIMQEVKRVGLNHAESEYN